MKAQAILTGDGDRRQTLVTVFLRGGADGLALVPPVGDDGYYRARPRLAVKREQAVRLDGMFGLGPELRELEPAWKAGELAIVHAAGSEDQTRSHFDAQDVMEHGAAAGGGWMGRFLRARPEARGGALRGVAIGRAVPEVLQGAPTVAVMERLEDFSFGAASAAFQEALRGLYGEVEGALGAAARDTFDALGRLEAMRATPYRPEHGASYGTDEFAQGMRQVARLIKGRLGVEAAAIDLGGWDSHLTQATVLEPLMRRLGAGLAAFRQDLGAEMANVTVVVMTEFGRRVAENSSFGTDHGRGSGMFVLGGGVRGGRVLGSWPGLTEERLEGPGDVPVTTNYRNVLAPILRKHGVAEEGVREVFPGFEVQPVPLYT